MTDHAAVADRVFRQAKKPPFEGQVRVRTWRTSLIGDQLDQTWMQRAVEYWNLQERLYGFRASHPSLHFSTVDGVDIVTTAVEVTSILPGRRVGRKEWMKWRLQNPTVQ